MSTFRQALAELDLFGQIIAADASSSAPTLHLADEAVTLPLVRDQEYLPALLETVRKHKVRLLVPVTDLDLMQLSEHREQFQQLGCTVMIGSPEIVSACRDKARTMDLVRRAGLETIPTWTLEEFRAKPFYPCFVKPVSGSASVGAGVIRGSQALEAHIARFGEELVIQECISGQEFTVDVYRDRRGKVHAVVPRLRLAVRSGEVERGIVLMDEEIISATRTLCDQLDGLWGVFCCQCRRPAEDMRPRFFEINPRFGGGAPLSIAAGANLPLYLLQEVLGMEIASDPSHITDRLLMSRFDHAVFVPMNNPEDLDGYDSPKFR